MLAPSHIVAGLAATVLVGRIAHVVPPPAGLLCLFAGALMPDIDGEGAITRPGTILKRMLPRFLTRALNLLGVLVQGVVRLIAPHRGIFHAPLLPVLFIAVGISGPLPLLAWFGLGYLSHILVDALTYEGIPLLAPFSSRRYSLRLMRTGGYRELLATCALLIVTVYAGYELLPPGLARGLQELWERVGGVLG